MYKDALPSISESWDVWLEWLARFGECRITPSGVVIELDPEMTGETGWTAHVVLTAQELHAYIGDYVRSRWKSGLGAGIDDGLPNPLTDSLFEEIGVQADSAATYVLSGLDFRAQGS